MYAMYARQPNQLTIRRNRHLTGRLAWLLLAALAAEVPAGQVQAEPPATPASSLKPPWTRVVDLTHAFDEQTIFWPTEPGFRLLPGPAGPTEAGYYYAANRFASAEHGGTHLDAPIHFFEGRHTVEQIPLERLIGQAVVVDIRQACESNRDYQVQLADLRGWEVRHGRQLVDVILLLHTGFGTYWPDAEQYLGTAEKGGQAVGKLHFPGLNPEAAQWLVEHRAVKAVGIDTASIDHGQSRAFQSHVTLFQHNVPVFENVARLEQLPEHGFWVVALPMKIRGGTGAPLRIVALLPDDLDSP